MSEEVISEVRVLKSGKLLLRLESGGRADYSFIYREGVGVYWENEMRGFVSSEKQDWSYARWFSHIVCTAASCRINLRLAPQTIWYNFPESEKSEVVKRHLI
jgi:hypothetical protein